tara:strand:- start:457 stop:726 length:270 start_codon:yes stop_codon:yes gene_type:complete
MKLASRSIVEGEFCDVFSIEIYSFESQSLPEVGVEFVSFVTTKLEGDFQPRLDRGTRFQGTRGCGVSGARILDIFFQNFFLLNFKKKLV